MTLIIGLKLDNGTVAIAADKNTLRGGDHDIPMKTGTLKIFEIKAPKLGKVVCGVSGYASGQFTVKTGNYADTDSLFNLQATLYSHIKSTLPQGVEYNMDNILDYSGLSSAILLNQSSVIYICGDARNTIDINEPYFGTGCGGEYANTILDTLYHLDGGIFSSINTIIPALKTLFTVANRKMPVISQDFDLWHMPNENKIVKYYFYCNSEGEWIKK